MKATFFCTVGGALPDFGQCLTSAICNQIPGPPNERAFLNKINENNDANTKPILELLACDAAYRENPTSLFHQVCGARPATLLLESADIDSKDDLKSLLLVDSALRITALGDTVTIQALSTNGASLLPLLDAALPAGVENEKQPNGRHLRFPAVSPLLDEDARLCSLSVFDAFRILQGLVNVPVQEREAMFFGGLFSYDRCRF